MFLIMSVNPGFGGQKFIPYTLEKIRALRKKCDMRGLSMDIEVDGGMNERTMPTVLEAGANVIVAGSGIFKGDPGEKTRRLLQMMDEFERQKQ